MLWVQILLEATSFFAETFWNPRCKFCTEMSALCWKRKPCIEFSRYTQSWQWWQFWTTYKPWSLKQLRTKWASKQIYICRGLKSNHCASSSVTYAAACALIKIQLTQFIVIRERSLSDTIEFSRYAQSWQCWHLLQLLTINYIRLYLATNIGLTTSTRFQVYMSQATLSHALITLHLSHFIPFLPPHPSLQADPLCTRLS